MGCVHGKICCSCSQVENSSLVPNSSHATLHVPYSVESGRKTCNYCVLDNQSVEISAGIRGRFGGEHPTDEGRDSETCDQPAALYGWKSNLPLPRLTRLSGQYLSPAVSRVATVPAFNYELRYSFLSQRGHYPEALDKANQDCLCVHTQFGKDPNDHFFGVFDGHGEYGTQCSQFVKKFLCETLISNSHFRSDVVQAYHTALTSTNAQLHHHAIDDSMSGTTSITVLVRGKRLYVANVGDSRAVLAERRGKDLVAVELSSDQTPFRTDECARVKLCGARVLTLDQLEGIKNPNAQCWGGEDDDDGDPPRLWVANGMYPGTAFTRSIGDRIAEQIGVIAVPEVLVTNLTGSHPFFVLASDGVFEFLSSQAVVDMVAKYKDPQDACAAVVAESYRLWMQFETRTDDITIIVVHINGLKDIEESMDAKLTKKLFELDKDNLSLPTKGRRSISVYPVHHDLPVSHLGAIEASLLHHHVILQPRLESHAKTAKELVSIESALQRNFLFNSLTEKQRHILFNCMERVIVDAGNIILRQGTEGDCFYVVESGEFEVLISQDEASGEQDLGTVVNCYNADMLSYFGGLALMYNKPHQSSVRAVTKGSLWVLRREVFHGVLAMKYSHVSTLVMLQNVGVLSHLTFAQLHCLADSLVEISFKKGDTLVSKEERLSALYIILQGEVQLAYLRELDEVKNRSPCLSQEDDCVIIKKGCYFGEGVLMGELSCPMTAVAVTDVECWVITKEKLDAAVGPLNQIIQENLKLRDRLTQLRRGHAPEVDIREFQNVKLLDLEWLSTVFSTDCCEFGLAIKKGSDTIVGMKRYAKQKVNLLGQEAQVLREKYIIQRLRPSPFVPQVLHICSDEKHAAILLNTFLVGPLALVLHAPLDEDSTRFMASSAVLALELLHKDGVVYQQISPDNLMLNVNGRLQLVDFRFGKMLSDERTFINFGMTDFLAPEVIKGQGHGFAADWWSLGVLIYFMLHNELPFEPLRESGHNSFTKISQGQLIFPSTFSAEVIDLLKKLLVVDETKRLGFGNRGEDFIKRHPWFEGIDWEGLLGFHTAVPAEILLRLNLLPDFHHSEEFQHMNGSAACKFG
eukprot:c28194_g2_i1 orf=785-4045(-)